MNAEAEIIRSQGTTSEEQLQGVKQLLETYSQSLFSLQRTMYRVSL